MMGSAEGEGNASERPRHAVTIAKPFAISKTEVPGAEYRVCVAAKVCTEKTGGNIRLGWPATELSWDDANIYAQWLSKRTGKAYRLPSEAEWEYAARAGSAEAYAWGRDVGQGNANCKGCGGEWTDGQKQIAGRVVQGQ